MFLPSLVDGVFPDPKVSDNWLRAPAALPADLRGDADSIPQLADVTADAAQEYRETSPGTPYAARTAWRTWR